MRKVDRTKSLLPPNASPAQRAFETVKDTSIKKTTYNGSVLMNPLKCKMDHLPWLAWAFDSRWRDEWTDEIKRQTVQEAIPTARKTGTFFSIYNALSALNVNAVITEGRHLDSANPKRNLPFYFEISVTNNTHENNVDIWTTIMKNKPLRTYFEIVAGIDGSTGTEFNLQPYPVNMCFERFECTSE